MVIISVLLTVLTILLTLTTLTIFLFKPNPSSQNLPPTPPRLPIIGNLHQIGAMPHLSISKLSQKLGPILLLHLGHIPTLFVSSSTTARSILRTHDPIFSSRPRLYSADRLFYGSTDIVFSPLGDYWRHIRKISILHLLSAKRVQSFGIVRAEEVALLISRVVVDAGDCVNVTKLIGLFANDVMCRVVLGRNYSEVGDYDRYGFRSLLDEYQELLGGFCIGDFFPGMEFLFTLTGQKRKVEKTFRRFDEFFDDAIEEHRRVSGEVKVCKDLLDVLLDVQRDGDGEFPLTMDNVKAILLDMFAAGTDTSFITLDWAMTELIMNPRVMKKAQEEIRGIIGEKQVVLESDLPQLHYLKAVIKEVFRLHPPVPLLIPRESIEAVTINGYDIPAKTRVIVNVWAIGRDPESWTDPDKFDPDRFVGSSIDYKGRDYELIPFGAGRRGCPGIAFSGVMVELALAQLLHTFDWELPPGVHAKDLDLTEVFGISMHKVSDLILVAKPRSV